jgi:hypothetical protein
MTAEGHELAKATVRVESVIGAARRSHSCQSRPSALQQNAPLLDNPVGAQQDRCRDLDPLPSGRGRWTAQERDGRHLSRLLPRAASGHVAAAPSSVMKSRRFIQYLMLRGWNDRAGQ